ncbi:MULTISPECIES: HD domain-containing phosphohydrolase [unclassified Pseudoalteromonas]|uniref:HD domain-containing phosphohydrolase n=1 Tax=unclassified Pseudoalteromonas TaxID=194690 RepID=UPI0020CCC035|nr:MULTISPECIES: HD domain-containing phosphohydrolase [unclassified Pseudoalteromonas]MDN3380562.1 response regulator [Pseudoalteromonas sp. APC 3893]MDN3388985.1 response regulator [Pseudoalteromonas sp. APC 4017]
MDNSAIQILCVDDDEIVLRALSRLLKSQHYSVLTFSEPLTALKQVEQHEFAVIISDMRMPLMNGAEFFHQAKTLSPDSQRILVTGFADIDTTLDAINKGQIHGFIQKPWQNNLLLSTISDSVEKYQLKKQNQQLQLKVTKQNKELKELNNSLEQRVEKRTKQIKQVLKQLEIANAHEINEHRSTVELLYNFINANPYLDGNKAQNIANTCTQIAKELNLPDKNVEMASMAGYLAQIGLLAMDPELYKKSVHELNEQQRKTFYTHPSTAQLMLMPATHLHDVSEAIYHQYEHYNGNGIPKGIKGNEIPLSAMILAISRDYWDHYEHSSLEQNQRHQYALECVARYSGNYYHPRIVAALQQCHTNFIKQQAQVGSMQIINAQKLKPNMLLGHALHSHAGIMLLPKGHKFSTKSIEKLQQLEAKKPTPFRIMIKSM